MKSFSGKKWKIFRAKNNKNENNTSVVGDSNRKLDSEELERMKAILEKGLKQGACGLKYTPGIYADVQELREVAKLCEKYDRPMTVHPKAESKKRPLFVVYFPINFVKLRFFYKYHTFELKTYSGIGMFQITSYSDWYKNMCTILVH